MEPQDVVISPICGLLQPESVAAAMDAPAAFPLVFFPDSPRAVRSRAAGSSPPPRGAGAVVACCGPSADLLVVSWRAGARLPAGTDGNPERGRRARDLAVPVVRARRRQAPLDAPLPRGRRRP